MSTIIGKTPKGGKIKFIELYLSPKSGEITDDAGKIYTPDEARAVAMTAPYRCNLAFARLVQNDFDMAATMAAYV